MAIDWAFAGIGPLGEEIAPLVVCSPNVDVDVDEPELWPLVLQGYLHGLQDAGWDGDELEIRFGCAASAALRYSFTKAYYAAMDMVDPARRSHVEAQTGQQIEAVSRREASRLSFLLDLADEARTLLPRLSSAR